MQEPNRLVRKQKKECAVYTQLPFPVNVVPEARIELAPSQGGLDFESSASTNFTTPASIRLYKQDLTQCQDQWELFVSNKYSVLDSIFI